MLSQEEWGFVDGAAPHPAGPDSQQQQVSPPNDDEGREDDESQDDGSLCSPPDVSADFADELRAILNGTSMMWALDGGSSTAYNGSSHNLRP